jgi:succinyl-diaminopimelate desuccinylase
VNENAALLAAIEQDRNEIFRGLVRIKSPDQPGDTREATAYIGKFLTADGLDFRTIAPMAESPNLMASFDASPRSRHLVLNCTICTRPAIRGTTPVGLLLYLGYVYA